MNGTAILPEVQDEGLGLRLDLAPFLIPHSPKSQSKSYLLSLPNISRTRLFLIASRAAVLAQPTSQWEKKLPQASQAHPSLPAVPCWLHRGDTGLLVGPFTPLAPLGLCIRCSLDSEPFLSCGHLLSPVSERAV